MELLLIFGAVVVFIWLVIWLAKKRYYNIITNFAIRETIRYENKNAKINDEMQNFNTTIIEETPIGEKVLTNCLGIEKINSDNKIKNLEIINDAKIKVSTLMLCEDTIEVSAVDFAKYSDQDLEIWSKLEGAPYD